MSDFNEGTRYMMDPCPVCKQPCVISTDLHKFGKHRIRYCLNCRCAYHNGQRGDMIQGAPDAGQPA